MSLEKKLMEAIKTAMKEKNKQALAALRAVKSELIILKTSGSSTELNETDENKILQKLVKQRKDSASIFSEQNREDLAVPELEQAEIISQFLPKQMSENEVEIVVAEIISKTGASSMKDMGKVMGLTNSQLAGKTDGKTVSGIVKKLLSN
tara:strand:- start:15 stop:464 length:450 start_codon:yes stop_codon:yes gene_type:complete